MINVEIRINKRTEFGVAQNLSLTYKSSIELPNKAIAANSVVARSTCSARRLVRLRFSFRLSGSLISIVVTPGKFNI